jgi:hypothetical protein
LPDGGNVVDVNTKCRHPKILPNYSSQKLILPKINAMSTTGYFRGERGRGKGKRGKGERFGIFSFPNKDASL